MEFSLYLFVCHAIRLSILGSDFPFVDLKFLNKMCNASHRSINLLGDGFIAFIFNFLCDLHTHLSLLLSQCGAHDDTEKELE